MMFHIEREIAEQPGVIRRLLAQENENAQKIAATIRKFDPAFVCIAARGTSDNAGRYAQYLLGIQTGLPVALATPSLHTLYESPPKLSRAVTIGISQSGQSEDVRRVLDDARAQGGLTISLTNDPESPLATTAAHHLALNAGEEVSVAATKTYTAQLAAIALLVAHLADRAELGESLRQLPDFVAQTLELSEPIAEWVQRYRYMEHFAAIGRGYNYATAYEVGLKIKELCYITGEQYSEADFRHGPIALIQQGFPVIVLAARGKTLPLILDLLEHLREQHPECLLITNDEAPGTFAQHMMPFPSAMPEWLSPVAAVIPGQIFAMRLALARGHQVDAPRGLRKVTVTE